MSMTVIEHIEVGAAGAAEIEFASIPQIYTDLQLVFSLRYSAGNNFLNLNVRFNDSSATDYSQKVLYGTGSSTLSLTSTSQSEISYVYAADSAAGVNIFSNSRMTIPNYTSSNAKSVSIDSVTENNVTAANQVITAGLWNNSAAISSIQLISFDAYNFVQYSSATLYGITAGSDGSTTVI